MGVYKLGGPRDNETKEGLGGPCDNEIITLNPGAVLLEPYRETCPKPRDNKAGIQYCVVDDKVAGQGVSIKVFKGNEPTNVFQMEYALVKNPARGPHGDDFVRLNYDVSLLDCGRVDDVTDCGATPDDHTKKVAACAGYKDGVAVTFKAQNGSDVDAGLCMPIYCDGTKKCAAIYTWDRTRDGEASMACNQEFKGDMHVDLCVAHDQARKS